MAYHSLETHKLRALLDSAEDCDPEGKGKWRMSLEQRNCCFFLRITGVCMPADESQFLESLERAFELYPTKRAVIDLSRCDYLSISTISVLISFFHASRDDDQVLLLSPPDKALKLMRLVDLDTFFLPVNSEPVAMNYFRAQGSHGYLTARP